MNDLNLNIRYDSTNNFIAAVVRHKPNSEVILHAVNKIIDLTAQEKCKKVLIDATNTTTMPSGFETFILGTKIASKLPKLINLDIAIAVSDKIQKDFRFFDTVLVNRAIDLKIFENLKDAKSWLSDAK